MDFKAPRAILFVKKKTGELRMVVDRALNKLTVKNRLELMTCLTNIMVLSISQAWMLLLAAIKSC